MYIALFKTTGTLFITGMEMILLQSITQASRWLFVELPDQAAKCILYGAGLSRTTSLHVLLQCFRIFSSPWHDRITIAFPFLLTKESTSQQRKYLPYWYHWGQRRLTFKWGHQVRAKAFCESPGSEAQAAGTYLRMSECVFMWEECAVKGQESAHILPQKEERRREESWVLGVGGHLYKYSKQDALFSNLFMCTKHVYNIVCLHSFSQINAKNFTFDIVV